MKSEINGKIFEIRGKAIETEEKINELTEDLLDYTITQKPLTDMVETHEAVTIRMDLPGLTKEDLKVNIGEDRVYIEAKFPEENAAEDVNYIQKERNHGVVMKSIPIPLDVKCDEAHAYFKNSILTIRIPKKLKKAMIREIDSL